MKYIKLVGLVILIMATIMLPPALADVTHTSGTGVTVDSADTLLQAIAEGVEEVILLNDIQLDGNVIKVVKDIRILSSDGEDKFIYQPANVNHIEIDGKAVVNFKGVILDGEGTGGGVKLLPGAAVDAHGWVLNECISNANQTAIEIKKAELTWHNGTIHGYAGTGFGVSLEGGRFTLLDGRICDNRIGIWVDEGELEMAGGEVCNNSQRGISISRGKQFNMSGGVIKNNGEGVEVSKVFFEMTGGEIRENEGKGVSVTMSINGNKSKFHLYDGLITENQGYGVYVYYGSEFILFDGKLTNNGEAGLYAVDATAVINGGEISGNKSHGILVKAAEVTMNDGAVTNNTESGVSLDTTFYDGWTGRFFMNGGHIAGNQNSGIRCEQLTGIIVLTGGEISGNSAEDGGGIYFRCASLTVSGGAIRDNTAYSNGGGIYQADGPSTSLKISGGEISGNTAQEGGGIYFSENSSAKDASISNCHITGNVAIGNGGGIYHNNSAKLSLTQSVIDNNSAENGGAIYTKNHSKLFVQASIFSQNRAHLGYSWSIDENTTIGDSALYMQNIVGGSCTSPFENLYNNYDINYGGNDQVQIYYGVELLWNDGTEALYDFYTVPHGSLVELPESLDRHGYIFAGWHLADGTPHVVNESIYVDKHYTLYAMWDQDYNENGIADQDECYTVNIAWVNQTGDDIEPHDRVVIDGANQPLRYSVNAMELSGYEYQGYTLDDSALREEGVVIIDPLLKDVDITFVYAKEKTESGGSGGISIIEKPDESDEYIKLTDDHIAYIQGYPDDTFRPEREITRAEVAMIFWRLIVADDKDVACTSILTDIYDHEWHYQAIAYLVQCGVLDGYSDGTFCPEQGITRAELVKVISQFNAIQPGTIVFPDVETGHWAEEYIQNSVEQGWVLGYPDGTFRPDVAINRAEAVTVINRLLGWGASDADHQRVYTDIGPDHWAYVDVMAASGRC